MKITRLKTYKFSVPTGQEVRDPRTDALLCSTSKPWLFLKIETDGAVDGWGEGTGEWLVSSREATLHGWSELLVGRDPLGFVALTEDIQDRLPWKGGPVFGTAIAAINMALYDIAGKAWVVPVHMIRAVSGVTGCAYTPAARCSIHRTEPSRRRIARPNADTRASKAIL